MKKDQVTNRDEILSLTSKTIAISHQVIPKFEKCQKWVRTKFRGQTIADSTQVMILRRNDRLPLYCFPKKDVRMDLLEETKNESEFSPQGTIRYWNIKVDSEIAENAAWSFLELADDWKFLKNYIIFEWEKMDSWFEESEEVFVHLRDPYHRIDVLKSTRKVRIEVNGKTIALTKSPILLFETGFPVRFYVPRKDVNMKFLEPSDLKTRCPYKGLASSHLRKF